MNDTIYLIIKLTIILIIICFFKAKIDEEYQQQKTLEKPEIIKAPGQRVSSSSAPTWSVNNQHEDKVQTVPPAPADVYPLTTGGEDKDPIAQERREQIKKVNYLLYFFIYYFICIT